MILWSGARLAHSGVRFPWNNFQGDFYASFPPPYVERTNPALFAKTSPREKGNKYLYGPGQHLFVLPFTYLDDPATIMRILQLLYLAGLIVGAAALYRVLRWPGSGWLAAGTYVLLWANYVPLYENLSQRNIDLLEFLLIIWAFLLVDAPTSRRMPARSAWAGAMIGYGGLCKLKPMGLGLHYLIDGNWAALGAMAGVFGVGVALTAAFIGLDRVPTLQVGFLSDMTNMAGTPWSSGAFTSVDLRMALHRIFAGVLFCTPQLPELPATVSSVPSTLYVVLAGGLGLAVVALLWRLRQAPATRPLRFSLTLTAVTVLSPHVQHYYYVALLLPMAYVWSRLGRGSDGRGADGWSAAGLVSSWLLSGGGPLPLGFYQRVIPGCVGSTGMFYGIQPQWVLLNLPTFGGMLLLLTLLRLAWLADNTPAGAST